MRFLVGVLVLAVILGYLARGRLRNIEGVHLRWWGLAPVGLVMQLIPVSGHDLAVGLLIASYPVLLAFALANIRLAGFVLIFVGLALNLTVIAANQGMPVTRHALVASGQGSLLGDLEHHGGAKHFLRIVRRRIVADADLDLAGQTGGADLLGDVGEQAAQTIGAVEGGNRDR